MRLRLSLATLASVMVVAGCSSGGTQSSLPVAPANTGRAAAASVAQFEATPLRQVDYATGLALGLFVKPCGVPAPGQAACHVVVRTDTGIGHTLQPNRSTPNATPAGYGPAQLQAAYGLTNAPSTTATIAIVDAYNAPTLAKDLAVYRSQFGLPACTTSTGCLRIVNGSGGTSLPRNNAGWATETSLDVDMASANCPSCKILVVEASSASNSALATAVSTAARLGAAVISNSYGSSESSSETSYASSYNHPGIAVLASSGDSGYGAQSPAAYNTVVAAGGTSLTLGAGNVRANETAWSGAGSGCSAYIAQPSWQAAALPTAGCSTRMIADIAYDADPNTGVAVYDSTPYQGYSGWQVYGGTSVASPSLAAIYARSGNALGATSGDAAYPASFTYAAKSYGSTIFDVTSGSNGSCPTSYFCHAGTGYDGPTGLGTPIGETAL